ncbi:MAG: signal peptidase II [Lachnospiraceae bacterium]|nr:signal peptidase II [Lachnospiraceae bacterium]
MDIGLVLLLIAADQLTKSAAVSYLAEKEDLILIDGVLQLHYLENRGAAFSMLQNAQIVFVIAALIMACAVILVLSRVPSGKRYLAWHLCLSMIFAGGIGNLIDRLRLSYVIDFIYVSLINFPVFNVADICVSVGVAVLVIFLLFVWKEEDMRFLERKNRKQTPER